MKKVFSIIALIVFFSAFNAFGQCVPPGITAGPGNVTVCPGNSSFFEIIATGDVPMTYQWQEDAGGGFNAISNGGIFSGADTPTLTIANIATSMNNYTYRCIVDGQCLPSATSNDAVLTVPNITATAGTTDVDCKGNNTGTAMVTAGGGTSPYTYSWSPGGGTDASISNLIAQDYTCTITDVNTCFITQTLTITEPPALTAVTGNTNVDCEGNNTGTAMVTAGGGTSPYTYSWSPGGGTDASISNLIAQDYTCTITDANSCFITQTLTITEPPALTAVTSNTNVDCGGSSTGTAMVTAGGGTSPYFYLWSPSGGTDASASNLTAGSYTCTITDNNSCINTQTVTITYPTATVSQQDVVCYGFSTGSATITVSGGTEPYNYFWQHDGGTVNTADNLIAQDYTCTVTDANSCLITQTLTITEPPALTAVMSNTNVDCGGSNTGTANVTPSGGTGSYTYLWSPSGGTDSSASNLTAGNYSCLITDANACSISIPVSITKPVATTFRTSVNCFGYSTGVAGVTVTKGTAPYTYLWSNGGTNASITGLTAGTYTCQITDFLSCPLVRTVIVTQNAALSASISHTDVLCNGNSTGNANISVSGPGLPFTYVWTPIGGTSSVASNIPVGTYTCTAKNAFNCLITKTVTISEPPLLTATSNQTDVLCHNTATGAAEIIVAGGTPPVEYLWMPGGAITASVSNLTMGAYSYTVADSNDCVVTNTIVISQPSAITLTTGQTNILCYGTATGSANITVAGGTSSYTYLWAPGGTTVANLSTIVAGTYSCTITDANNCESTTSVSISQLPAITAVVSQSNSCNSTASGSANITAAGGTPPFSYSWDPGGNTGTAVSGLSAGNYTCTTTDSNSCAVQSTFTIIQSAPPAVTLSASTDTICTNSGMVTLTGTPSGGAYSGEGVNGNSFNTAIVLAGTYSVSYTYADELGCNGSELATIYVDECLGISTFSGRSLPVKIYPNPFVNTTTLEVDPRLLNKDGKVYIDIYDGLGRAVKQEAITKAKTTIILDNVPAGIYFYRVTGNDGFIATGRLILQ